MSRAFAILFLLALSLGIYLGTTSAPALVDEADCAHAIAARELRESGDWAVLHINGIRYLEKAPPHSICSCAPGRVRSQRESVTGAQPRWWLWPRSRAG